MVNTLSRRWTEIPCSDGLRGQGGRTSLSVAGRLGRCTSSSEDPGELPVPHVRIVVRKKKVSYTCPQSITVTSLTSSGTNAVTRRNDRERDWNNSWSTRTLRHDLRNTRCRVNRSVVGTLYRWPVETRSVDTVSPFLKFEVQVTRHTEREIFVNEVLPSRTF